MDEMKLLTRCSIAVNFSGRVDGSFEFGAQWVDAPAHQSVATALFGHERAVGVTLWDVSFALAFGDGQQLGDLLLLATH